ncbi:MAG: hypothetical protein O2858_04580, partial [Proteobacteria bacterium]|nr:hypothetical protein [Pseudomonadota bacterium]
CIYMNVGIYMNVCMCLSIYLFIYLSICIGLCLSLAKPFKNLSHQNPAGWENQPLNANQIKRNRAFSLPAGLRRVKPLESYRDAA